MMKPRAPVKPVLREPVTKTISRVQVVNYLGSAELNDIPGYQNDDCKGCGSELCNPCEERLKYNFAPSVVEGHYPLCVSLQTLVDQAKIDLKDLFVVVSVQYGDWSPDQEIHLELVTNTKPETKTISFEKEFVEEMKEYEEDLKQYNKSMENYKNWLKKELASVQ